MISVVIPIYNVELYLRQCLDSLDVLGRDDVEVILVNDGSTDSSRDICVEYKEKWSNVILIDKENGGLSDARNKGTEVATGEYICYVDSDDWLVHGAIEKMYQFAVNNNCEVVQCGFFYAFDDHVEHINHCESDNDSFVLSRQDAMRELVKNMYVKNFAWGKIYKTSIVKAHSFPYGKYYEDTYWLHFVIHDCTRYGVMSEPLYYYRQRKDSISGGKSHRLFDMFKGLEEELEFMENHYPELTSIVAMRLWSEAHITRSWDKDFKMYFEYVNSRYSSFLSNGFKNSLYYKLNNRNSIWLPLYNIYRKIKLRFEVQRLK